MIRFEVKQEHLALLRRAYVSWDATCFGAPAIDSKRPYGNSDVLSDVTRILGWKLFEDANGDRHLSREQHELAERLHGETAMALQIILCSRSFEAGWYVQEHEYDHQSWTKEA